MDYREAPPPPYSPQDELSPSHPHSLPPVPPPHQSLPPPLPPRTASFSVQPSSLNSEYGGSTAPTDSPSHHPSFTYPQSSSTLNPHPPTVYSEYVYEPAPPLPPRSPNSTSTPSLQAPVPRRPALASSLDINANPGTYVSPDFSRDPRTHSSQSIPPATLPPALPASSYDYQHLLDDPPSNSSTPPIILQRRRKLLLVYIHGFLGNTTSFNHLPSHLHNLLTFFLSISCPSYSVHTKVYPRFKTRHAITEAAEMFSQWLADHEAEDTDIILLGHSMGGLLSGEVVLLPPLHPIEFPSKDAPPERRYRHRILGMVGFDVPFLGLHPGVITSGISSLFRPTPKSDKRKPNAAIEGADVPQSPRHDEGPSAEDLFLRRKPEHFNTGLGGPTPSGNSEGGALGSMWNFLNKHRGNIPGATMQYLLSHMEFAACLADPIGLNARYKKLRSLEDGDGGYRVHFVNYYTICWGREKEDDRDKGHERQKSKGEIVKDPVDVSAGHRREGSSSSLSPPTTRGMEKVVIVEGTARPRKSQDGQPATLSAISTSGRQSSQISRNSTEVPHSPLQITPESLEEAQALALIHDLNARSARYSLPPLPLTLPSPAPPLHPDLSHITDPKVQKAHMKENKRLWKEHFRQEKVHRKLIKEREKILAKLEAKDITFGSPTGETCERVVVPATSPPSTSQSSANTAGGIPTQLLEKRRKPKKERKFCLIPKEAKSSETEDGETVGAGDDTWVKVPMHNVDEVGAHCGLFLAGTEIVASTTNSSTNNTLPISQRTGQQETGFVGADGQITRESIDADNQARAASMRESIDRERERDRESNVEKKDLEIKRRQYEKLVGDVAARIEGWVKEHIGTLEALEVAGDQAKWDWGEEKNG